MYKGNIPYIKTIKTHLNKEEDVNNNKEKEENNKKEEEYKKKNDPAFCWTFLRAASFFEYKLKEGAKERKLQVGNIE